MHTVEFTKFLYHFRIISWNQFYSKLVTKEVVFTEFFQKIMIQKFRKIHIVRCKSSCSRVSIILQIFPSNQMQIKLEYSISRNFPLNQFAFDLSNKIPDFFRQINCKWNCRIQFDGIFRQIKSKWSCSMYVCICFRNSLLRTSYFETQHQF